MTAAHVRGILVSKFEASHIDAALQHYSAAIEKYLAEDWDGVALKAGKFVEAITKALMLFCGKSLPADMRSFKAGSELRLLENSPGRSSTVRIVIPKACVFIYEIETTVAGDTTLAKSTPIRSMQK